MSPEVDVLWDRDDAEDDELIQLMVRRGEALMDAAKVAHRTLSVVLTDDPRIAEANSQWRGIDRPTDVLSFPMDEGELLDSGGAPDPLGDVVISLETATRQAADHDLSVAQEVTFLLIHGFCHLLGHDHGEPEEAAAMRAEEDRLLAIVDPDLPRPPTPY